MTHHDVVEALNILRKILPQASEPLIAGGWLRDLINGDEPHDIDVFIASDAFDATIEHLQRQAHVTLGPLVSADGKPVKVPGLSCLALGLGVLPQALVDAGVQVEQQRARACVIGHWTLQEIEPGASEDSHPSAGEDVMRVYEIRELYAWPVQLIEVPDPLAWVRSFDAYCNMIVLPVFGDEPVRAISSLAMWHARERIFTINPLARESDAVLKQRMQKFEARGYDVSPAEAWFAGKDPGLDALDLQAALDTVNT